MNNNNGRGREIFYGVIGVATLVVAIIGATFAYFTASAVNNTTITGNAATINLSVAVTKITHADENKGGMIPMSNSMVHPAVSKADGDVTSADTNSGVCLDDNGNAVCQIYKITLTNSSTAAVMVDGYTALINGSGTPTDYTYTGNNTTTMRWAQASCTGTGDTLACSTEVTTALGVDATGTELVLANIDNSGTTANDGKNSANIRNVYAVYDTNTSIGGVTFTQNADKGVLTKVTIGGNDYPAIGKNYIRVSDHNFNTAGTLDPTENYDRQNDITSALVYNQYVAANGTKDYYIVVWLTENGQNQTIGATGAAATANNFFSGQVKFISSQGSEVSATFGGFSRVTRTD